MISGDYSKNLVTRVTRIEISDGQALGLKLSKSVWYIIRPAIASRSRQVVNFPNCPIIRWVWRSCERYFLKPRRSRLKKWVEASDREPHSFHISHSVSILED